MSDYLRSGHDMWQDHKDHYGVITARIMCIRYLDMQARSKDPEEREFCRELREAMAMERNLSGIPLYRKSWDEARRDGESPLFDDSDMANRWCAGEIDEAIAACEYGDGTHRLEPAVHALLDHCGEERLSFLLAIEVRRHRDGFSAENRAWSDGFDIRSGFAGSDIRTRTDVLDEFIACLRETMDRTREAELPEPALTERLERAAEHIIEVSARETTTGNYVTYAEDIPSDILSHALFQQNIRTIADMLRGYGAVSDAEATPDGAVDITVYLDYCPNYAPMRDDEEELPENRQILDPLLTKGGKAAGAVEKPELNESERNFAAWLAVTESSRFKWVEDEIYRLNGRGAMYYTGGEDGIYMRIRKDGTLEAGSYEGAVPHIGEAMFQPTVTKQFPTFSEAYTSAMEAGGKQFMADMFSGYAAQPPVKTAVLGAAGEKPSVLKQIREAQKAPQPPRKPKEPRKNKNDIEH